MNINIFFVKKDCEVVKNLFGKVKGNFLKILILRKMFLWYNYFKIKEIGIRGKYNAECGIRNA